MVDLTRLTPDTQSAWAGLVDAAASAFGLELRPRSARRTCAEQNGLYKIGRLPGDTRAVVTHARGCQSWHVLGRAVDFYVYEGGQLRNDGAAYKLVGGLAKSRGWKWGGDFVGFPDIGHVEYHPGITIEKACPDPSKCSDDVGAIPTPPSSPPPSSDGDGGGGLLFAALFFGFLE